jgi:transcriptional regulator with XRE-family HTH domain
MEAQLTFGEYMRRLRRARKWNLNTLAAETGISYTHLSRLENDSVLPSADSVARLAIALDGDLKAMLEMANCLPQTILDRINSQEQQAASPLMRTAGPPGNTPGEPAPNRGHNLLAQLKQAYHLDDAEARVLANAIEGLVSLEKTQRSSVISLITSLSAQKGTQG